MIALILIVQARHALDYGRLELSLILWWGLNLRFLNLAILIGLLIRIEYLDSIKVLGLNNRVSYNWNRNLLLFS